MKEIHKFPRTPHLFGSSKVNRDDLILSEDISLRLLNSKDILLQEKIDGSNLGISFDKNGNPLFQHRGEYINPREDIEFNKLPDWYEFHEEELFDILEDKRILFGEWCYYTHSVPYERLPSFFLAFDLFEKERERFSSQKSLKNILEETNIEILPIIKTGLPLKVEGYQQTLSDYDALLEVLKGLMGISHYGPDLMEGIYIREEEGKSLKQRAKYVRKGFNEEIIAHWKKSLYQNPTNTPKNKSLHYIESNWT